MSGRRVALTGLLGLGLSLMLAGVSRIDAAAQDPTTERQPPPAITALLPAGSELVSAHLIDLFGSGVEAWVLLSVTDPPLAPASRDAHVTIISPGQTFWTVAATFTIEGVIVPLLFFHALDGRPAIFFQAGVGAHGAHLTVVRWDGGEFVTLFDEGSDTPLLDAADLDGDGAPEIVRRRTAPCGIYAVGPRLVEVYRWDGSGYAEATAAYPLLLAEAEAAVRELLGDGEGLPASLHACFQATLAYLADRAGDSSATRAACESADAIDRSWRREWAAGFC